MSNSKLQPYADIIVKTGEYQKDGKTKARWKNIGVFFSTPHASRMVGKLDALPIPYNGEIWLDIRPREGMEDYLQLKQPESQEQSNTAASTTRRSI